MRKKSRLSVIRKNSRRKSRKDKGEDYGVPKDFDSFLKEVFTRNHTQSNKHADSSKQAMKVDSDGFEADEFYVVLDKPYKYSPEENVDVFAANLAFNLYRNLKENVEKQIDNNSDWINLKKSAYIQFIQVGDTDDINKFPCVTLCLNIDRDFSINISVHGRALPGSHNIWKSINRVAYSVGHVKKLFQEMAKYRVCSGNNDNILQDLRPIHGYRDESSYNYRGYKESTYMGETIRSKNCLLLVASRSNRCQSCKIYRKTLIRTLSRRQSSGCTLTTQKDLTQTDWTKSKVPNAKLNQNQKMEKLRQMRAYTIKLKAEVAKSRGQINHKIGSEGDDLNKHESLDSS